VMLRACRRWLAAPPPSRCLALRPPSSSSPSSYHRSGSLSPSSASPLPSFPRMLRIGTAKWLGVHLPRPLGLRAMSTTAQEIHHESLGVAGVDVVADSNPLNHQMSDIGRVYPFDKKGILQVMPEGLAGYLHKILYGKRRRHPPPVAVRYWYDKILKDKPGILIRKETMKIIAALRALAKSGVPKGSPQIVTPGFLLDGSPGIGKSTIINHCVHWARSSKEWIVVFIPEASRIVRGGGRYERSDDELGGTIYQPEFGKEILQHVITAHRDMLQQLPLKDDTSVMCSEVIDKALASKVPMDAMNTLVQVMETLQDQTKFPVLVAVDEINALNGMSMYLDFKMKPIPAKNVVVAEIFGRFLNGGYKRGLVLGAATRTGDFQHLRLPPFHKRPIQVSGLTRDEIRNMLTFQQNQGEFFTKISDDLLDYLVFVSEGRPLEVEKMAAAELFNIGLKNLPKKGRIGKFYGESPITQIIGAGED